MTLSAVQIFNGLAPTQGPRALPVSLDFGTVASIESDLYKELAGAEITFVQSIWIDNKDNMNRFQISFPGSTQVLRVPANSQGCYPVFGDKSMKFKAITTAAVGLLVPIIFINVPMPFFTWQVT